MRRRTRLCLILSLSLSLSATGCATLHGARTEETFSWSKVRGWLHLPESESDEDPDSTSHGEQGGKSFLRHWQTGMAP